MDDDRWYSSAYAASGGTTIINEVASDVRRFGSGYLHDLWYIRRALSGGSVACLPKSDRIVYGFEVLPMARAYGSDGSMHWTAAIRDGYLQLRVMEICHPETGRVGYYEAASSAYDRLLGVHAVGDGDHVLLSYARVLPDEKEIVPQHYLLDAATGGGAFLGEGALPAILSIQRDGYVSLGSGRSPAIYLEVWRTAPGGQS